MVSKEENIEMLENEVGVTLLKLEEKFFVGSYRCDLVAQDETSGAKLLLRIS